MDRFYDGRDIDVSFTARSYVRIDGYNAGVTVDGYYFICTKEEAIAAARAILKHFNATLESDQ